MISFCLAVLSISSALIIVSNFDVLVNCCFILASYHTSQPICRSFSWQLLLPWRVPPPCVSLEQNTASAATATPAVLEQQHHAVLHKLLLLQHRLSDVVLKLPGCPTWPLPGSEVWRAVSYARHSSGCWGCVIFPITAHHIAPPFLSVAS